MFSLLAKGFAQYLDFHNRLRLLTSVSFARLFKILFYTAPCFQMENNKFEIKIGNLL